MSACQWVLWGPDSIWLTSTHTGPATLPPHETHSHTLSQPLASNPLRSLSNSLWHSLPRWHQPAPLAWWPSRYLVRSPWLAPAPYWECFVCGVFLCMHVRVCLWACLSGTSPVLLALCHCHPTTWSPSVSFLHFVSVTPLMLFSGVPWHFFSLEKMSFLRITIWLLPLSLISYGPRSLVSQCYLLSNVLLQTWGAAIFVTGEQ